MQPGWCQPIRQEFMENECEALPGVAYPGVRDNRSTINIKTGYDDMMIRGSVLHVQRRQMWSLVPKLKGATQLPQIYDHNTTQHQEPIQNIMFSNVSGQVHTMHIQ